jgi:nucleotide-binding universal stress UspA family protein
VIAVSEEMPRVVVGVDGSERGDAALRRALREASRLGGRLEVVSAWEPRRRRRSLATVHR